MSMQPELRPELLRGAEALGCALDEAQADRLLGYLDLMARWNKVYNLTALRDPAQMLTHHLLDSLAVVAPLRCHRAQAAGADTLLDVGSGGGLPGIPLAIARPDLEVTLVDTVQKKVSFLQQAAIELELPNVRAVHGRVEGLAGQYPQITSRAFSDLGEFVGLTRHLLAPGGRWLAMKGVRPAAEMAALPAEIQLAAILPLVVPGLAAERHLLILKAGS